jgi:hypothetical protein
MSFNDLRHFPRWLFRRLFEVNDYDLDIALDVSSKLNDLKRGEWVRLLIKCDNWLVAAAQSRHSLSSAVC